jgi:hypothetical protein
MVSFRVLGDRQPPRHAAPRQDNHVVTAVGWYRRDDCLVGPHNLVAPAAAFPKLSPALSRVLSGLLCSCSLWDLVWQALVCRSCTMPITVLTRKKPG